MAAIEFALNHMVAPDLSLEAFFDLAVQLEIGLVEIRNDLDGTAILDGTSAATVRALASRNGLSIISINALQRFNDWTAEREEEARQLAEFARDCGAKALVLVPFNDTNGETDLRKALSGLQPILDEAGIVGFVEPLGFESCSLRSKQQARLAIREAGFSQQFRLVHDTFHHHLAGEGISFPGCTGLVHISGVINPDISIEEMRDPHRVLVGSDDRLGNISQIISLMVAGYNGPFSFEPFAAYVEAGEDRADALRKSMDYIRSVV